MWEAATSEDWSLYFGKGCCQKRFVRGEAGSRRGVKNLSIIGKRGLLHYFLSKKLLKKSELGADEDTKRKSVIRKGFHRPKRRERRRAAMSSLKGGKKNIGECLRKDSSATIILRA